MPEQVYRTRSSLTYVHETLYRMGFLLHDLISTKYSGNQVPTVVYHRVVDDAWNEQVEVSKISQHELLIDCNTSLEMYRRIQRKISIS